MTEKKNLRDIVAGWPENAPKDSTELMLCDNAELESRGLADQNLEMVKALRAEIRRAAMSWSRTTLLGTPQHVEDALASGDLRLLSKRWVTLALDGKRRRTFVPFSGDSAKTVEKISRIVPEVEWLPKLPENGAYLLLWGGSPEVLDIPDVRTRLQTLAGQVPVVDVLFRFLEPGPKSTLYSLKQGFGVCNRVKVEFPNTSAKEISLW